MALRPLAIALLAPLAFALSGCGGGLPLLYPARVLPAGDVRAVAGFSSNVALGGLSSAARNAASEPATGAVGSGGPPRGDVTYAEGALALATTGPGLAPVAGARVGVGGQAEAGLAFTGRAVQADLRRSFDFSETTAFSVGLAGLATLYGRDESDTLPDVDLGRLHGWGAEVPLVLGYESTGGLYMLWVGARAGWEHIDIDDLTTDPSPGAMPISLSATSLWAGGLVGAAVGFRHLHVAMELDTSYASVTGNYDATHAHVRGVTMTPAAALWWRF